MRKKGDAEGSGSIKSGMNQRVHLNKTKSFRRGIIIKMRGTQTTSSSASERSDLITNAQDDSPRVFVVH